MIKLPRLKPILFFLIFSTLTACNQSAEASRAEKTDSASSYMVISEYCQRSTSDSVDAKSGATAYASAEDAFSIEASRLHQLIDEIIQNELSERSNLKVQICGDSNRLWASFNQDLSFVLDTNEMEYTRLNH